jgi:hypothetical protein
VTWITALLNALAALLRVLFPVRDTSAQARSDAASRMVAWRLELCALENAEIEAKNAYFDAVLHSHDIDSSAAVSRLSELQVAWEAAAEAVGRHRRFQPHSPVDGTERPVCGG